MKNGEQQLYYKIKCIINAKIFFFCKRNRTKPNVSTSEGIVSVQYNHNIVYRMRCLLFSCICNII